MSMLIAQITDLHIDDGDGANPRKGDTRERLGRTVAFLNAFEPRPHVVVTTGDLTDRATAAEYAAVRDILDELVIPNFLIPGNHDDREGLRRAFPHHAYLPRDGFIHYAVDGFPLRLIGLDTLVPGSEGGLLCRERRAWLEGQLVAAPDRPTFVFMHHPPFRTGIPDLDGSMCAESEGLNTLLARHRQVVRVACGHLHRTTQVQFGGTLAGSVPGVAPELAFNLGRDERCDYVPSPPQVGFHLWQPSGLVTHVAAVPDRDAA